MPFCTTGFAASDPYGATPVAAFPVSLNVHASASLDTFADEIVEPVASRVFARSPFGYGQAAEVAVAGAAAALAPEPQAATAPVGLLTRTATGRERQGCRHRHAHPQADI